MLLLSFYKPSLSMSSCMSCFFFLTCRYLLLLYAIYKTISSIDNEGEIQKWLKYWMFYGMSSFLCSYTEYGDLIKTIICGVLLLKFNVSVICVICNHF